MSSRGSNEKRFQRDRSNEPLNESSLKAKADTAELAQSTDLDISGYPHSDDPSDVDSLNDTIVRCQLDLSQKDELITALIRELEQAVDQLDRFQRNGATPSRVNQSATSPYLESTDSSGLDDVRRMAEDWNEAQPSSSLSRIESQLAAMHDLVLNLQRDGHRPQSTDRPQAEADDFEERLRRLNNTTEAEEPDEADESNLTLDASSADWEAIKREILGSESAPRITESLAEDTEILKILREAPAPIDVDFAIATPDDLKQAVNERDAYIIQLNRLLRAKISFVLPTDWAALANVPGEMQIRVETILERLDVQVRLGEVEMSLERARLARERSQIQSESETIEKHLRRLGLTSLSELDNISAAPGTASDRRWMRFLGPNTK